MTGDIGIDHVCNNENLYNFKNVFNNSNGFQNYQETDLDIYSNIGHSCKYMDMDEFSNKYSHYDKQVSFFALNTFGISYLISPPLTTSSKLVMCLGSI